MIKKISIGAGGLAISMLVASGVAFAQTASPSPSASPTPSPSSTTTTTVPSAAPSTGMGGN